MIVEELIEKLQKLPPDADIKLKIWDRVYDRHTIVDLDTILLEGSFNKGKWEVIETFNQTIWLEGIHE